MNPKFCYWVHVVGVEVAKLPVGVQNGMTGPFWSGVDLDTEVRRLFLADLNALHIGITVERAMQAAAAVTH